MEYINSGLILEVSARGSVLKMSLFERESFAQTVRHYNNVDVDFKQIQHLSEDIINSLNRSFAKEDINVSENIRKTGQLLWDYIIAKPVKEKLKYSPSQDLILSLEEELSGIPWEMLYDGADFLALKFNIGRLLKSQGNAPTPRYRSLSPRLKMLILADPGGDLKSSYQEGLYIRNRFEKKQKRITIDFKSTQIEKIYVKKNLRDYDIVHFAGHCEYNQVEPLKTGWILSDGKFSIEDIQALAQSPHFPSLVFSNSCHSAVLGAATQMACSQRENYNLAQAFLFAGVRHYIGSIRKIEDNASLAFASEFYDNLVQGRSIGECMRLGRLKLQQEYGPKDSFWTSYLLYGDPSFSFFSQYLDSSVGSKKDLLIPNRKFYLVYTTLILALLLSLAFRHLPTLNPQAYSLYYSSKSMLSRGENKQAIASLEKVITKDPLFLDNYMLLADVYHRTADIDNAIKYYSLYAAASEKKKDYVSLSKAYINLGWVYHLQGNYPKALDFYNKALTLSIDRHDKLNQASALRKLAIWYLDKEDYDKSLELLVKSSEINRNGKGLYEYKYNLACDYFDIGLVFTNKEDYGSAKEFYNKSRKLFESLKLDNELSDYWFNLGEISLFDKEYNTAISYYKRGLAIDQKQGNLFNLASDYNMMGEFFVETGDIKEAERYFEKALDICRRVNLPMDLASVYYNLGMLYKAKGQKQRAIDYLKKAQEIYSSVDTPDYANIKEEILNF